MKKLLTILIAFILFISFAGINVFADNIDKAKVGQKIFAQTIGNNEITVNNNEDDDFSDIDAIIGNCEISDEELAKVVGEAFKTSYDSAQNSKNPYYNYGYKGWRNHVYDFNPPNIKRKKYGNHEFYICTAYKNGILVSSLVTDKDTAAIAWQASLLKANATGKTDKGW